MAQISLVKTLVLSYLELQRQIDTHHIDAPAYVLRDLRDQQAAILASLEAKEPIPLSTPEASSNDSNGWSNSSPDAMRQLGELLESQKEQVDESH